MKALRIALLRELRTGPLWRLRDNNATAAGDDSVCNEAPAPDVRPESSSRQDTAPSGSGIDTRNLLPQQTESPPQPTQSVPKQASDPARDARIGSMDWDDLEAEIRNCRACRLWEQRRQAVPGIGDRNASWMFVGEGPGSEEDRRGEPFVGPAGKLLDAMLAALGLERGQGVYIANAVKCRPPMNRTPHPDETDSCRPFLERQIALVRPKVLVALGRPAAQTLLETEVRISTVRGKVFSHDDIPVVVTYHPAYLLRNPSDKGKAWEDLCLARRVVGKTGQD